MKGMERITTVRLAEALSQTGAVANEKITDALFQQDSSGVPFVEVLVDSGEVSEWELARLVVQTFQLPFLMASNVDINPDAVRALPEDFLFEHRLLPLDLNGSVLTVSMPVLVPYKVLQNAETLSGRNVFPFVGLMSENSNLLRQLFPNRKFEDGQRAPESRIETDDASWESIFDVGEQQVLKDLGGS